MPDLTDLDTARQHIPTSVDSDEPVISGLITAASRAIQKFCRRDFVSTTYDELYNGDGQRRMILRQYPLLQVDSVRYRPVTVLKIINNTTANVQARVQVTNVGLTLTRVNNGIKTTDTSLTFAGNATILALQTSINAMGNGWAAAGTGYDTWPSADLWTPNGRTDSGAATPYGQGALTAAGQNAELKMHTYELAGYQLDNRRGWLLRAIPYTDPELLHPEDLIWPVGINNFRVQYTAGYATIPEDVQEACAELVATWFVQRGRDLTLASQSIPGAFSFTAQNLYRNMPERIRVWLAPYRYHRIYNNQS